LCLIWGVFFVGFDGHVSSGEGLFFDG
jgi:hypothetical protein